MEETSNIATKRRKTRIGLIVAIGVVAFNAMNVPKEDASSPDATYRAVTVLNGDKPV